MRQPPGVPVQSSCKHFILRCRCCMPENKDQLCDVRPQFLGLIFLWATFKKQLWARQGITLTTHLYKSIQAGVCIFSIGVFCTVYIKSQPFLVCNVKSPVFVFTPLLGLLRSNRLCEFLPKFKWKSRVHCSGYPPPLFTCISLLFCMSPIYLHTICSCSVFFMRRIILTFYCLLTEPFEALTSGCTALFVFVHLKQLTVHSSNIAIGQRIG